VTDEDFVLDSYAGADERMARNLAAAPDLRVPLNFDERA
jgi:hypothetical protein